VLFLQTGASRPKDAAADHEDGNIIVAMSPRSFQAVKKNADMVRPRPQRDEDSVEAFAERAEKRKEERETRHKNEAARIERDEHEAAREEANERHEKTRERQEAAQHKEYQQDAALEARIEKREKQRRQATALLQREEQTHNPESPDEHDVEVDKDARKAEKEIVKLERLAKQGRLTAAHQAQLQAQVHRSEEEVKRLQRLAEEAEAENRELRDDTKAQLKRENKMAKLLAHIKHMEELAQEHEENEKQEHAESRSGADSQEENAEEREVEHAESRKDTEFIGMSRSGKKAVYREKLPMATAALRMAIENPATMPEVKEEQEGTPEENLIGKLVGGGDVQKVTPHDMEMERGAAELRQAAAHLQQAEAAAKSADVSHMEQVEATVEAKEHSEEEKTDKLEKEVEELKEDANEEKVSKMWGAKSGSMMAHVHKVIAALLSASCLAALC